MLAKLDEVGPLPPVTPRAPPKEPILPMTSGRQGLRRISRSLSGGGSSSSLGAGASSSQAAAAGEQDKEEDDDEDETEYDQGRGVMSRGGLGTSSSSLSSMPVRTPPALLIPRHTDPEPGGDSPVFPPPEKVQKLDDLEVGEADSIGMMYGSDISSMGLGGAAAGAGATAAQEGLGGSHLATETSLLFGGGSVGHSAAAASAEGFGLKPEAISPSPLGGFPLTAPGAGMMSMPNVSFPTPSSTGLGGLGVIGASPPLASAAIRSRSDAGAGAGVSPPPAIGLETMVSSSSDTMPGYLLGSGGTDAVASALEGLGDDIMGSGDLSATAGDPVMYGVSMLRGASVGDLTTSRGSSVGGDVMPIMQPAAAPSTEVTVAAAAATTTAPGDSGAEMGVGSIASGAQAVVFSAVAPATSGVLTPATSDAVSASAVDAYLGAFPGGLARTSSAGTSMPRTDPAPPAPGEPRESRFEGRGSGAGGGDSNVQ